MASIDQSEHFETSIVKIQKQRYGELSSIERFVSSMLKEDCDKSTIEL